MPHEDEELEVALAEVEALVVEDQALHELALGVDLVEDELEEPSHSPQVVVPSVFLELVVEADDQADQLVAGSVVVVLDHSDQVPSAGLVLVVEEVVVEDHSDQVVAGSVVVVEVDDQAAQLLSSAMVVEAVAAPTRAAAAM